MTLSFRHSYGSDINNFYNLIYKWKPSQQVWSFKYGDDIAGVSTFLTSWYASFYLRRGVKLVPYCRGSVFAPTFIVGGLSAFAFHRGYVSKEIINQNSCPVCILLTAAVGQFAFGSVFNTLSSAVASFYFADRYITYPVPNLAQAPREAFALLMKILIPRMKVLSGLALFQVILATFITSKKQSTYYELREGGFRDKAYK